MRILRIRLKNLNSLAGEWAIDLTHPAYAADGIFAITGPTGSGKTTLLDAVCLALYAQTPRLGRISKGGNEIMSRESGECFAEVTFETQAGRFRCHWSQRRARKKPDGELQPPKHELADADSGEIIASKLTSVAERIEAVTGMDFDRFTRSMLLAQGGFAAFLQAEPGHRAEILERITGTEIYSDISIRVHERLREEREHLQTLQAEMDGMAVLGADEEDAMRRALDENGKEEAARGRELDAAMERAAWLKNLAGLEKERAALAVEAESLHRALTDFAPQRAMLARALDAALLDGSHATLTALRAQVEHDTAALREAEKALPGLTQELETLAGGLALAAARTAEAKNGMRKALPLLQTVRALDQRLAELAKQRAHGEKAVAHDAAKLEEQSRLAEHARLKKAEAHASLAALEAWLAEHKHDAWLVSGLAGIEEQVNALLARQNDSALKEAERARAAACLEGAQQALAGAVQALAERRHDLLRAAESIRLGKRTLDEVLAGRLLREYRADKEALLRELALRQEIAQLKDYRARLEDGKPCPLCGARAHPFAAGNAPAPRETERAIEAVAALIEQAEAHESGLRRAEEAERAARTACAQSEQREAVAAKDREAAEKALAGIDEALALLRADCERHKALLAERLSPLGLALPEDGGVATLLAPLRARLAAWQEQAGNRTALEKRLADLGAEMDRLNAVMGVQRAALTEKTALCDALQQDIAREREKRLALFGEAMPDDEERRLGQSLAATEDAEKKAGALHEAARQKRDAAMAAMAALRQRLAASEPQLKALESGFLDACRSLAFAGEPDFLAARLDARQRDELAAKARGLDDRQAECKARQKDREERLALERAKMEPGDSLDEVEAYCLAAGQALRELRDNMARLAYRLNENERAKERAAAGQKAAERQKHLCREWENLHDLVGSADGKKYRTFAQGLTFDIMIAHANLQLQKMTDRYLLLRDSAQQLELNVIDTYQGGVARSIKNLSGGESFIVSLSLALGLSRMSSKKIRVDSLFLDEGFGSLDDESLDTALDTLAALQREGKLIGVISHVPAIRERIGTQIQVRPLQGGRSRLSGPGCSGPDAAIGQKTY